MAKAYKLYSERRVLRTLEKSWAHIESFLNRFSTDEQSSHPYNPLYHLGTLAIYLLIILAVTGTYLTVFYRPGSDRAYESMARISGTWVGLLMRTVHRYASDGLIVVTLIHTLKTFISDRFWGSRWLAWLSGWVLLALFWSIGVMGYWLVWDQPAQWLTEFAISVLKGSFALPFVGPEIASRTFAFFVIILFLHIFLSVLIVIGVVVHVMRLTRVRILTPRWVMAEAGVILVVLSLWRPVALALPADMGRLISTVNVDWWYLGFLPLTAKLGNPLFWGLSLIGLAAVSALPWLALGRHVGPAVVTNPNCTGCALCSRECPYDAIQMVGRDDETRFRSVAEIYANLCTGCGICVGTCSTSGIELQALHSTVLRQDMKRSLRHAKEAGLAPVAIFTCDRQLALGAVPSLDEVPAIGESLDSIPVLQAPMPSRVSLGTWAGANPHPIPVVTMAMPCVGMLHPQWVRDALDQGARAAIVAGCPSDDCSFREGPYWVSGRLSRRRRTLPKELVHYVELAPGSSDQVAALLKTMGVGAQQERAKKADKPDSLLNRLAQARYLVAGTILLAVTLGISLLLHQPATNPLPEQGLIRVAINHGGKLIAASDRLPEEIIAKLPSNIEPAQVLGGERFPVRLRLEVDGEPVLETMYKPRGLRHEGTMYGLETWWLPPGEHFVQIWLMDDELEWRSAFADTLEVKAGHVSGLVYDEVKGIFFPFQ